MQQLNDANSLDVMPSYNPNGDRIVYASNRTGRRLTIWERSTTGIGGIISLADNRDEQDLWPSIDADPHTHLFYEALFDGQPDGHLYMATLNSSERAELTVNGISEPRISPNASSIVFVNVNERTGKREIYRMPIEGGTPELLASSPDADCYDPCFSADGSKLAFASDLGLDAEKRHNPDIWVIDLAHPEAPEQVTRNGSVDDCPAWDPKGNAIYFRSNRGGAWGIWRIDLH